MLADQCARDIRNLGEAHKPQNRRQFRINYEFIDEKPTYRSNLIIPVEKRVIAEIDWIG